MTYRTRGETPDLKTVLAKIKAKTADKPIRYVPIQHCTTDIIRAKTVLERLLALEVTNEVSSIRVEARLIIEREDRD
jgi:hypothetical protein